MSWGLGDDSQNLSSSGAINLGGKELPRIAFGAEQLGGYGWGTVDFDAIEEALISAIKLANVFVDTADCYGLGSSERRLQRVLAMNREAVFLSTKFGVRFDDAGKVFYDNCPDYAERALDGSLARLGVDKVDLFQLHWPDNKTPLAKVFERLERIRDDGRIGGYGVSNFPLRQILDLPGDWPGFLTFSTQYSLVHRHDEDMIDLLCQSKNLMFLGWGSLAQGLLSGKYDSGVTFTADDRRSQKHYLNFQGERFHKNLAVVALLKGIADRVPGVTIPQLAIRFILDSLPRSLAIVGIKSVAQYKDVMGALTLVLEPDAFAELDVATRWSLVN